MTKVTYIAGTEAVQRAGELKPKAFIPYLDLTKGEMQLALMQEQAGILAAYYGNPKYREAETMIQNALYRGIHGATPYLGAYAPELRRLAVVIDQARRQTQPASAAGFYRPSIGQGIHIGAPVVDYDARGNACKAKAYSTAKNDKDLKAKIALCEATWRVEKILNDGIENCGQYLAYGYLPASGINGLPSVATYKILQQTAGQQDIGRVGKFGLELTQQWLNVGMMRRNADTAKIEPYGWSETNTILTTLPEAGQKELLALLAKVKDKKGKIVGGPRLTEAEVGRQLAAIVRKYQGANGIGVLPVAAAVAIIGAVTALVGAIAGFAKSLKAEENDAFAQVNGFGTRSLGPAEGDWDGDGLPDNQPGTGTGIDPLWLVGGAAAAYLLLKK